MFQKGCGAVLLLIYDSADRGGEKVLLWRHASPLGWRSRTGGFLLFDGADEQEGKGDGDKNPRDQPEEKLCEMDFGSHVCDFNCCGQSYVQHRHWPACRGKGEDKEHVS